jgi:hypothetical protein
MGDRRRAAYGSAGGEANDNGEKARGERRGAAIVLNTCPIGLAFKIERIGEGGGHKYGGSSRI